MAALITTRGLGRATFLLASAGLGITVLVPVEDDVSISLAWSVPTVSLTSDAPDVSFETGPDLALTAIGADLTLDPSSPYIGVRFVEVDLTIDVAE
jgi:hypothetical protein